MPDDRRAGAHAASPPRRGAQLPGVPGQARRRRADRAASSSTASPAPVRRRACSRRSPTAERIVIVPSSPVVSIGTILGVPGRAGRAGGAARGLRGRQPDHRRAPGRGPGRPLPGAARATPSARPPRWRASTPTWPATFVLDARDEAEAAGDRGARRAAGAHRRPDARPAGARPAGRRRRSRRSGERRRSWAVVPVKPLGGALRRLAAALDARVRRELQVAMLTRRARRLRRRRAGLVEVLVVTADPEAARPRRAPGGARVVPDHDPPRGMNAAVERGLAAAAARRRRGGARPHGRPAPGPRRATSTRPSPPPAGPGRRSLLVPSRDGTGTNAMLLRPPTALRPAPRPRTRSPATSPGARRGGPGGAAWRASGARPRHRHPRRPRRPDGLGRRVRRPGRPARALSGRALAAGSAR